MDRIVLSMERNLTEQIALRVAGAIGRANRSHASVYTAAGIPKTTFGRKINGQTDFYMTELVAIALELGISIDAFIPESIPMAYREKIPA